MGPVVYILVVYLFKENLALLIFVRVLVLHLLFVVVGGCPVGSALLRPSLEHFSAAAYRAIFFLSQPWLEPNEKTFFFF